MKAKATASSAQNAAGKSSTAVHRSSTATERQSHGARFTKVFDGRKQPIRGLWQRNGRFYAQLKFEDANTGAKKTRRVPLLDKDGDAVQSAADAKAALEKMRTQRADNTLPILSRTPTFAQFVDRYIDHIKAGTTEKMKRDATIAKEQAALKRWAEHLGGLRLDKIKRAHVNAFLATRKRKGMSNRTVNLDVIQFRNAMKHAIDEGHIQVLPTLNMRPLTVARKKRNLFTPAEMERLCGAAFGKKVNSKGEIVPVTKNAQEFTDYIKLLAYSGARRNEALRLRWQQDVDFDREQLTISAEGNSKNSRARVVDFNTKLETHLRAMHKRRAPDSQWLFPSPQRGEQDIPAASFRESLEMARKAAGIASVGFHDFRHLFISFCVMSGIDYMTVAKWVGHQDGGVLIGKVYGHLNDTHTKAQAKRVSFEPQIVKEVAA
jgi:integrase